MPPPQQATSSTTTPASDEQIQTQKDKKLSRNDPSTTVKRHIRLLHEYNEIKNIAQGLMGLIADARGVRQVDVQREYGLDDRD
ncbi:hypothetical protein RIB2604_03501550 [Aspergillus luchuensis]|uniref:DNA repair protein Swi5/Sae3 n=1 Tax=Aspergillus kawachii TaxID=1069201 RepID=A0A146FYU6_ASPKA|nr:hypothetical protein RIB2604_03501550 [Aspergillus luchuensis]